VLILSFWCVYFIMNDLVYFIDWNIKKLNDRCVIMTFLFDWMPLLFIGFVFLLFLLWLFFVVMITCLVT
jgi:hypothetical protein